MFITYILVSPKTGKHYIGSTNDLDRRLTEHNRGQTTSTRHKGPWVVIYQEIFNSAIEAKKREQQLKSYKGGAAFKKLIA